MLLGQEWVRVKVSLPDVDYIGNKQHDYFSSNQIEELLYDTVQIRLCSTKIYTKVHAQSVGMIRLCKLAIVYIMELECSKDDKYLV